MVSSCVSEPCKYFTSIPNVDWQSWEQSNKFPHQIHTSPLHPLSFSFMAIFPIKVDRASLYYWDGGGEGISACPFMAQKQGATTQTKTHSRTDHGNDTAEPPAISYQTLRFSFIFLLYGRPCTWWTVLLETGSNTKTCRRTNFSLHRKII